MNYFTQTKIDSLIGQKIVQILVNENTLVFKTENNTILLGVAGDCCSRSWWYKILNPENVIFKRYSSDFNIIESIEEIPEIEKFCPEDADGNYYQIYGFRLVSNIGHSDFMFINSSNGYYGGWMYDVDILTSDLKDLKEISEDWLVDQ